MLIRLNKYARQGKGEEILVNTDNIISIEKIQPAQYDGSEAVLSEYVNINCTDGKFISVSQTMDDLYYLINPPTYSPIS